MHILYLATDAYGGYGGVALYNRDVLEALCDDPAIDSVTAVARSQSSAIGELPEKLHYDTSGVGSLSRYFAAVRRAAFSRQRPDVIYCSHINLAPVAYLIAKMRGVPWVLCIYGIDAWPDRKSASRRFFASRADRVISLSNVTLQRFLSWCPMPADRCIVIPNAIHLDEFGVAPRNQVLEARYGLANRKVVMTFGRLDPTEQYKGFDEIIELMPELLRKRDDIAYLIAGAGADRERLEQKAAALGVADRVVFTGMVDEAEKADTYRLADVYAMPSKGEGFGFVILEAMACGVPAIASNQDGGQEAVRGGLIGQVVDPDKPAEIEQAILAVIDQPKAIPEGLHYFAFPSFKKRVQDLIHAMLPAARKTAQ